jgi:hypothetical protein
LRRGGVQVVTSVGGQPHDGVGPQDAPSQFDRRIVLPHVDAVGAGLERQVRPVVQYEGDAVGPADAADEVGAGQKVARLEVLLSELDDVDAAGDAGGHEVGQVRAVRRAQVEAAAREAAPVVHPLARALAFMARLFARTFSRVS